MISCGRPKASAGGRWFEFIELEIDGLFRRQLLESLRSHGVALNAHAETLLLHPVFDERGGNHVRVVERAIEELGLTDGGTLPEIFSTAADQGLELCPPETDSDLRLAGSVRA